MNLKKIVLLISLFMTFAITGCGEEKQKQTEEVKIDYTPIKITEKYPEALQTRDRIMKEIRESIKSQKVYRIKKNLTNDTEEPCPDDEKESHDVWSKKIYIREKMYDLKNREIYQIEDREAYSKGGGSGARKTGGGIYRYCPKEEGTVYDEKGRVKSRIKVLESENKYSGIEDSGRKSVLRNEERFGAWHSQFTEYKYDEKGNISKEEITMLDIGSELYEKEIKEYENGKVKKSSKVIDCEYPDGNTTLIYVEITKEYDENEKLIKKFVLRKNKFNSVRSETNFDLIKGEIITKYYEGDKVFATVTETLIGKDRAIVKRERVGDEFVIWDLVKKADKGNGRYDKYYINKKDNSLMYVFRQCDYLSEYDFNHGEIGINKDIFAEDIFSNQLYKDVMYNGAVFTEMEEYINNIRNIYVTTDKKSADSFFIYYTQKEKGKFLEERIKKYKTEIILEKININKIEEDFKNGY